MKATEQYFNVVLFIMLYKVVLTFKFVDETLKYVTIQIKATKQYFHVIQFIMLYKVVLTSMFLDETLVSDHSVEATDQYSQKAIEGCCRERTCKFETCLSASFSAVQASRILLAAGEA